MQKTPLVPLIAAKGADTVSSPMLVDDFDTIVIQYSAWGGTTTATTLVKGSISVDAPAFGSAASATNHYDNLDIIDMEDGASIDGDTGIVSAAAHFSNYEVNVAGLRWIALDLDWTAGTVTINVQGKNYNAV
jgi:hypothetical protein